MFCTGASFPSGKAQSKILVVDDQPIEAMLVADVLQKIACVTSANDGEEAVAFCQHDKPDLVVMDINMPRMDGISACRHIKSHETTADIPVMFLSGGNDRHLERRCWDVGCTDYLAKPFKRDIVQYRVQLQLALKRHLEELRRITCFNNKALLRNLSWFDCLLENQLQISSRRSLPLSLICIEIENVDKIIAKIGYSKYDLIVTRLNQLLEKLAFSYNHVVTRSTRNRFYCLFPESGQEAARHMAFLIYQYVYQKNVLNIKRGVSGFNLKVCALTNYAAKTRGIELVMVINKMLHEMAEQGVFRGMRTGIKARNSAMFDPLYHSDW